MDELGEQLADILSQSREQTSVITRLGDRIDDIYRYIVEGGAPFLPQTDDRPPGGAR